MRHTDPFLAQLGPRLRQARQDANLTARQAADRLGIDHTMIVRYESGDSLPPLDRLVALADIYGLTAAALLARHEAAVPVIVAIDQAEAGALGTILARLTDERSIK